MPKIHTIPSDQTINGNDKLLGSDSAPGALNVTKNYVVDDLKNYILSDAGALSFKTISVSGQDDIVAEQAADTLTFAGGGDVTITTNASTDTITITGTGTDTTYTAGSGLSLAAEEFSVDGTVVRTSGNQTINDVKTFSSNIVGSVTGNAGTVTDGVYVTGDQTIGGNKTFSQDPTAGGYAFSSSLGKVKEAKVNIGTVLLNSLSNGTELVLVPAPGASRMIIPISISIKVDYATTTYNFSDLLYIGHKDYVSSNSTDHFYSVPLTVMNATAFGYFTLPQNVNSPSMVSAVGKELVITSVAGSTVTQGDSDITFNILYREVDFS